MPAFCANARIFSRSADAMRVLNLMSFFMCSPIVDKVGLGFCPKTVRKAGSGVAADQTNAMLAPPEREDFPRRGGASLRFEPVLFRVARTSAQRGALRHSCAHIAGWAKSRTQRRHAPHGALRVLDTPAGSIGTIFSVVGRSAPSTLFRQIRRSPLLFRNETKMPFCLRVSTLFRI